MSQQLDATQLKRGDLVRYRANDTAGIRSENDSDTLVYLLATVMQAPPFKKKVGDGEITFEEGIELRSRGPLKQRFIIHVHKLEGKVETDERAECVGLSDAY